MHKVSTVIPRHKEGRKCYTCPQMFIFRHTRHRGAKYRMMKPWLPRRYTNEACTGRTSGNKCCVLHIGGVDPVSSNCQEGPSCGNNSSSRVISHTLFHSSHPTTEIITYPVPSFRTVRQRPAFTTAVLHTLLVSQTSCSKCCNTSASGRRGPG